MVQVNAYDLVQGYALPVLIVVSGFGGSFSCDFVLLPLGLAISHSFKHGGFVGAF